MSLQPPALVKRSEVDHYPTDFSAMSYSDMNALSLGGEQMAGLLASRNLRNIFEAEKSPTLRPEALEAHPKWERLPPLIA